MRRPRALGRPPSTVKYVLKVSYDGSSYFGFQKQPHHPTVQQELERALGKLFDEEIHLVYAGRTDTGVHGLGQVAAFEHPRVLPARALVEGVNCSLTDSVTVLEAAVLPDGHGFHPRYSALSRTYEYRLLCEADPADRVLWSSRAWCLAGRPDLELLREAAGLLVGEHDFRTFTSRADEPHYRREVFSVEVVERGEPRSLVLTITANAFLRKMVRLLVAGLVEVGLGLSSRGQLLQRLEKADPDWGPHPAPAQGLYFRSVQYPPDPFREIAQERYKARSHPGIRVKRLPE